MKSYKFACHQKLSFRKTGALHTIHSHSLRSLGQRTVSRKVHIQQQIFLSWKYSFNSSSMNYSWRLRLTSFEDHPSYFPIKITEMLFPPASHVLTIKPINTFLPSCSIDISINSFIFITVPLKEVFWDIQHSCHLVWPIANKHGH